MFERVGRSAPVRWVSRRVNAAMETILGRSVLRLTGAKPRVLASAIAYNLFFAAVPLVFGVIAIASLAGRTDEALRELADLLAVLPAQVAAFLIDLVEGSAEVLGDSTGIAVFVSLAVALWSGSRAALTLMEALEVIEGQNDTRSFVTKRLIAIAATLGLIIALLFVVTALVLGEVIVLVLEGAGSDLAATAVDLLAEPVAGVVLVLFLVGFYEWAPPDPFPAKWTSTLVSAGGIAVASWAFGWLVGAGLFGESTTLAVLGSVALVLIWLYLVSYVLIVAAAFSFTISNEPEEPSWGT